MMLPVFGSIEGRKLMSIPRKASISLLALVIACISGCGGNPTPSGTKINVTFTGPVPVGIAERIGTANWAEIAVPTDSQLSFTIPNGTTDYAIAYLCPDSGISGHSPEYSEYVFEATISDPTTYNLNCITNVRVVPSTDLVTGSFDASAIPNTAGVVVYPIAGEEPGSTGTFSSMLVPGIYDFAALALDTAGKILGVKFARGQTVPGVVNDGNPIKFLPSDAATVQSISVTNDPWGGGPPLGWVTAGFTTRSGTSFDVMVPGDGHSCSAVPSSEVQSGDYYTFGAFDTNPAIGQAIGTTQTATNASAVTVTMPAPMDYSAPVTSTFPNFTINYSGFPVHTYTASITWGYIYPDLEDSVSFTITTAATASFQNGATTLAIPDLSSLSGFVGAATSGTTIYWSTSLSSGTTSSGSSSWVKNSGSYVVP